MARAHLGCRPAMRALAAKMPEQSAAKEAEDGYASDDDETEQEEGDANAGEEEWGMVVVV